jgi:hypothetical protein
MLTIINDIEISHKNLEAYPENEPQVVIGYCKSNSNKTAEGTSIYDLDEEDSTEEEDCPFIVHGLTGMESDTKSVNTVKVIALQHFKNNRKMLTIGCVKSPESIYNNL